MDIDTVAVTTAFALWAAAVVSPGPAFAAIVHRSVSVGRQESLLTVLGITTASGIYGLLTIFGVGALIATSDVIQEAVRLLGAVYLIWLGISAWKHAAVPVALESGRFPHRADAFFGGLMIEFGNPKGIAFFLSVFAVAMPADASLATKLLTISGGLAFELAWYAAAALILGSHSARRAYGRAKPTVERLFGGLFVGLGMHLLLSRS